MASSSSTSSVALDSRKASESARAISWRVLWAASAIVLLAVSWRYAEVDLGLPFRPTTLTAVWKFLVELFPPDLSPPFLHTVSSAVGQTIATAVAATVLSVALALPLAVLATGTLWNRGVLVSAETGS